MAKLLRPAFDAAADEGQRGDEFRVAVALQDLRGNGGGAQAQLAANGGFDFGIEIGVRADRAGNFAHADGLARRAQARRRAPEFIIHQRHFEAEGGGFRVNAVAAANHGRIGMAGGLRRDGRAEFFHFGQQHVRRRHQAV